jgi:hypothetical protein
VPVSDRGTALLLVRAVAADSAATQLKSWMESHGWRHGAVLGVDRPMQERWPHEVALLDRVLTGVEEELAAGRAVEFPCVSQREVRGALASLRTALTERAWNSRARMGHSVAELEAVEECLHDKWESVHQRGQLATALRRSLTQCWRG